MDDELYEWIENKFEIKKKIESNRANEILRYRQTKHFMRKWIKIMTQELQEIEIEMNSNSKIQHNVSIDLDRMYACVCVFAVKIFLSSTWIECICTPPMSSLFIYVMSNVCMWEQCVTFRLVIFKSHKNEKKKTKTQKNLSESNGKQKIHHIKYVCVCLFTKISHLDPMEWFYSLLHNLWSVWENDEKYACVCDCACMCVYHLLIRQILVLWMREFICICWDRRQVCVYMCDIRL